MATSYFDYTEEGFQKWCDSRTPKPCKFAFNQEESQFVVSITIDLPYKLPSLYTVLASCGILPYCDADDRTSTVFGRRAVISPGARGFLQQSENLKQWLKLLFDRVEYIDHDWKVTLSDFGPDKDQLLKRMMKKLWVPHLSPPSWKVFYEHLAIVGASPEQKKIQKRPAKTDFKLVVQSTNNDLEASLAVRFYHAFWTLGAKDEKEFLQALDITGVSSWLNIVIGQANQFFNGFEGPTRPETNPNCLQVDLNRSDEALKSKVPYFILHQFGLTAPSGWIRSESRRSKRKQADSDGPSASDVVAGSGAKSNDLPEELKDKFRLHDPVQMHEVHVRVRSTKVKVVATDKQEDQAYKLCLSLLNDEGQLKSANAKRVGEVFKLLPADNVKLVAVDKAGDIGLTDEEFKTANSRYIIQHQEFTVVRCSEGGADTVINGCGKDAETARERAIGDARRMYSKRQKAAASQGTAQ